MSTYSVFVKYRAIFERFSGNRSVSRPGIHQILFWMSFQIEFEQDSINVHINFDWMCFPKIGLAHTPGICQ